MKKYSLIRELKNQIPEYKNMSREQILFTELTNIILTYASQTKSQQLNSKKHNIKVLTVWMDELFSAPLKLSECDKIIECEKIITEKYNAATKCSLTGNHNMLTEKNILNQIAEKIAYHDIKNNLISEFETEDEAMSFLAGTPNNKRFYFKKIT
jgi:hypothetical protein